jgi:hypothetical protein
MGLESATYISDLIANWPLPTDKRREGDDHLRLIKVALKNTFPNINGPVTATQEQLNSIPENLAARAEEMIKHLVPQRAVMAFSGTEVEVPEGWAICDGRVAPGIGTTPDLRGRFIMGSSVDHLVFSNGGDTVAGTSESGVHSHSVQGTAITAAQMPSHAHRLWVQKSGGSGDTESFAGDAAVAGNIDGTKDWASANGTSKPLMESTGSGQPHTHESDPAGAHTHTVQILPPYYVLAYIIKYTKYLEPT